MPCLFIPPRRASASPHFGATSRCDGAGSSMLHYANRARLRGRVASVVSVRGTCLTTATNAFQLAVEFPVEFFRLFFLFARRCACAGHVGSPRLAMADRRLILRRRIRGRRGIRLGLRAVRGHEQNEEGDCRNSAHGVFSSACRLTSSQPFSPPRPLCGRAGPVDVRHVGGRIPDAYLSHNAQWRGSFRSYSLQSGETTGKEDSRLSCGPWRLWARTVG